MSVQLSVLLPPPLSVKGTSYTCGQIVRGMAGPGFGITVITPRSSDYSIAPADTVQVLPGWARSVPYPWVRRFAKDKVEAAFLDHAARASAGSRAAYIWADASTRTIRNLRRSGVPSFREMINGPRGVAKPLLERAYRDFGVEPRHGISDASIDEEDAALAAVDYVFCANALVEAAVSARGVSPARIISASYGWDPARFAGRKLALAPAPGLTAVFVGSLSIRKGVHLLLQYWAESRVKGRLVLAGKMEPVIREKCASYLSREDVIVMDYVNDVATVFRSADVFVFPSLEEGGPQVVYEACGCGLPVVTTPMGAGRIVRNEVEGFILDADDRAGWIAALRIMAEDGGRRDAMAEAAVARADRFRWSEVARRRRDQISERLGLGSSVAEAAPSFVEPNGMVAD